MNEQVEKILADVGADTLTLIARDVIDDDSATLTGDPVFAEITTPHNDDRTVGIVKVSGSAVSVRFAGHHKWSSIVKIIDLSAPIKTDSQWVFPENEETVYELGLLTGDKVPLRPAKCYLTHSDESGLRILWLEDLSNAPQPPWSLEQFIITANHLGQFNGYHSVNKTELPFEVTRDSYYVRMSGSEWSSNYAKLLKIPNDPIVQRVFGDTPLEPGLEYSELIERGLEVAKSLPHGLAFGDCHSRNLFPLGSQTVGIDWASLTYDPVGCDIGVLIGSPFTFTEAERGLSAEHEHEIYESYIDGLKSSGWSGNVDHVRLAFFMHFSWYLLSITLTPLSYETLKGNNVRRAQLEKRFGIPFKEFPELHAQVAALVPKYAEEFKQLLTRVEGSL